MTRYGTRRPPTRSADGRTADHRRALVLGEVAAEGPVGLFRVLRRAHSGDTEAAGLRVSALVRALPSVGMLDCHDVLLRSRIDESAVAGDLDRDQRIALVSLVDRIHPYEEPRM